MRGTRLLVVAAFAAAALFSLRAAYSEEERTEADAPAKAADHLGSLRYALVIGIDDYADRGIPDLKASEANARGLRSILVDPLRGGMPEDQALLLLGAEATGKGIRAALEGLRDLPREATLFVYFAGYGAQDGDDTYWVPQDVKQGDVRGTALADAEVRRLLEQIPAERILLLMDCPYTRSLGGGRKLQVDPATILPRYHGARHATVGAVGSEERLVEADETKLSVFSHYVIQGLAGVADKDDDGVVSLGEFKAYLGRRMRIEARKRRGLEQPVADVANVRDPAFFFLTVQPDGLRRRLLEDEGAETLRRERLAALDALLGDNLVTAEQAREGHHLLGVLPEGFAPHELDQRALFIELVEGRMDPPHLADALVALRREDRRTLVVPDEFKTIQAAIDAAVAGDTVFVKEGQYHERVVFKTGLCLRGEGRERTVIQMVPGNPESLLAQDCAWGVIESLQVDGSGGTAIGDWSPDGIHLNRSSIRLYNCIAHSCLGCGLYATGAGCRPHLRECTFEKNQQDGACLGGTEGGVVVECISRSNNAVGLQVRESLAPVLIRGCRGEFNKHAGIGVCSASTALVEGNDCRSNGGHGILIWDKGTSATLVENSCTRNDICGIYLVQGASAVARGNTCSRNKECGVLVSGPGTSATLEGNHCEDNEGATQGDLGGIVFSGGATGDVTSNICDGNVSGILVTGTGTSAQLRDNTCRKNRASGIAIADSAAGDVRGNHADENQQGITVSRAEATLEDNTLRRNTEHGIAIVGRAKAKANENRCEENEGAGIHVADMGTRADLLENVCATNGSHGIEFARGAVGLVEGNDCLGNKAFGILAINSGTRPTLRKNRCTGNTRAGIGQERRANPIVEDNNTVSGNGE